MPISSNTHSTDLERDSIQSWQRANADAANLKFTTTFTLSARIRMESLGNYQEIISAFYDTNGKGGYRLMVNITDVLRFDTSPSGGSMSNLNANTAISTNTWYHVVATYDSAVGHKIYLNGVQDGSDSDTTHTPGDGGTPFKIGNRSNDDITEAFDGLIDDVRVWNRVLTDTEISNLNTDPCNFDNGSGLQGWWLFDNAATDSSSNGYTLTGVNSPTYTTTAAYSCASARPHLLTLMGVG